MEADPYETDEEELERTMELKRTIAAMVARKNAAAPGSAKHRMAVRQLQGLRYSHEMAGPIIESLDEEWGSYCTPMPVTG